MKTSKLREAGRDYSRWRVASLLTVHLLIALHIAHWLVTGRTLAPLEFNEVLHTLHLGVITAGFLFMALTVVGTLVRDDSSARGVVTSSRCKICPHGSWPR